jgi:hypothetical protein
LDEGQVRHRTKQKHSMIYYDYLQDLCTNPSSFHCHGSSIGTNRSCSSHGPGGVHVWSLRHLHLEFGPQPIIGGVSMACPKYVSTHITILYIYQNIYIYMYQNISFIYHLYIIYICHHWPHALFDTSTYCLDYTCVVHRHPHLQGFSDATWQGASAQADPMALGIRPWHPSLMGVS